jgi:FKBP-type peptidyl-prolyl cis-trans isomerase 2
MTIKQGSKISIEYEGSFDDGKVFDASKNHGKPLEFEIGAKMVIPGLEKALIGMKKDEEKTIHIEPADAYGEPNPQAVQTIPKSNLPAEQKPEVGMTLVAQLPNGQGMPGKITKVTDKEVTIDFNHPLAGKALNFKVKVIDVK